MTISTLIALAADHQRKTGRRLSRVDLQPEDVAELRAEVEGKPKPKRCCCACHQHEPRQGGYVMTLVGVDVYAKGES